MVGNVDKTVALSTLKSGLPSGKIMSVDLGEIGASGGSSGFSEESEETVLETRGDDSLGGFIFIGLDTEFVEFPNVGLMVFSD